MISESVQFRTKTKLLQVDWMRTDENGTFCQSDDCRYFCQAANGKQNRGNIHSAPGLGTDDGAACLGAVIC